MELLCRAGGIVYQGILRGNTSAEKDSYDRTKVKRFFDTVVFTTNTEKLAEKRTGDNGEDVEHAISKAFQRVHV